MGLTSSVPNSILQPGVCTSTTRPAAPYHGQVVFETDTQKTLFYNGTAWVILNDPNAVSIDSSGNVTFDNDVTVSGGATVSGDLTVTGNMTSANQGLVLLKTQLGGTNVSSITVSDAFTSAFHNYLIIVNNMNTSGINTLRIRLGSATSGYYGVEDGRSYVSGITTTNINNGSALGVAVTGTGYDTFAQITVLRPAQALRTGLSAHSAGSRGFVMTGYQDDGTAFTSFTLLPDTGTLTGGYIRVYGYGQ